MKRPVPFLTLHLIGGLLFLSLPILYMPGTLSEFSLERLLRLRIAQVDLIAHAMMLGFFYLSYYCLVPAFFIKKRYVAFTLIVLLVLIATYLLPQWIVPFRDHLHGSAHPHHPHPHGHPPHRRGLDLFFASHNFFVFLVVLFTSLSLRLVQQWRRAEREKLSAELSFLKAQVNPHFLFNTLNSIYSLALSRSEETASAIVKLSGMMRYVITDATQELVPLEKELEYIRDYIDLQALRLDKNVTVTSEIEGSARDLRIAPLLLIPLIENAYKYGVNPEEPSFIRIRIRVQGDTVELEVANTRVHSLTESDQALGIGLNNTRSRLELFYPDRHRLEIRETADQYLLHLAIRLA